MNNKKKFLKLVSEEDTKTIADVKDRIKNRDMLHESQQIALKVLVRLKDLGWSQKDLANQLNVSPQQVTKIVSGKENMTIDTLIKLQRILNIPIFASFNKNKMNAKKVEVTGSQNFEIIVALNEPPAPNYQVSKAKAKTVRKKG